MNTPRKYADNEEPELGAEESIPLDGKDPEGEEMMKDLGRDETKKAGAEEKPDPLPEQFPAS
ncbi:hypothetical protein [Variovorax saccharolyticus]|jgi:hypothetical protein|uniref:hypothetical protein n=1 Tax=Variovorax saccharolyticus TaxID=3053516 RepID=UPI0025757EC1|nr:MULTISPECIES: hypothetical protein [unclassified Variovorax]MDM0019048.1 hypothetical protein [Variovorax sp. J22R187]MDM0026485.1 hypothetical protein [Variovorax sp. J31P216]